MDEFLEKLLKKHEHYEKFKTVVKADYRADGFETTSNLIIDKLEIKTLVEITKVISSSTLLDGVVGLPRTRFLEFLHFCNSLARDNYAILEAKMRENPKSFLINIYSPFLFLGNIALDNMESVIAYIKNIQIFPDPNKAKGCMISIDFNFDFSE